MKEKKEKLVVENDGSLLEFLFNKKNLSKKKIKQYAKYNMILVNNKIVNNVNYLVKKNDLVILSYDRKVINDFNIEIIYEDKDIIVINKPCFLLSISNSREKELTAFRMVRDYVRSVNPKTYLFVIHRLDEDTSGILMFAKNEKTKKLFQDNWNNIVKKRIYLAVVSGFLPDSGSFHSFLRENKFGMVYSGKSGKEAITEYKVLKRYKDRTLVEVNILTGRRNQIRVHFSENGNPIIGDKKYGSRIKSDRMMLHALRIEFVDPRNGKFTVFSTNVPSEFDR